MFQRYQSVCLSCVYGSFVSTTTVHCLLRIHKCATRMSHTPLVHLEKIHSNTCLPIRPGDSPAPTLDHRSQMQRKLYNYSLYSVTVVILWNVIFFSSQMLLSPRRVTRKIPKTPFKVLDAPDLQDDYYLNLLDWSSQNVLAVGLGTAVYLWNASTCQVRGQNSCLADGHS